MWSAKLCCWHLLQEEDLMVIRQSLDKSLCSKQLAVFNIVGAVYHLFNICVYIASGFSPESGKERDQGSSIHLGRLMRDFDCSFVPSETFNSS